MSFTSKKAVYVFYTSLFLLMIVFFRFLYITTNNDISWLEINSLLGWLTIIWSVVSWKGIRNEIISMYTSFYLLLTLFTYGQSLLIIFDLVEKESDLIYRFTTEQLIETQFFTLMCLIAFHLGALINCKNSEYSESLDLNHRATLEGNEIGGNNNAFMIKAIKITGFLLLALSLPGFIYDSLSTLSIVAEGGYRALYGYQSGGASSKGLILRIFEATGSYYIPSQICLLIAFRKRKKIRRTIYFGLGIHILNSLYIGGRGSAVALIIVLLLLHHYTIEPLKSKKVIKLVISSYFVVSFLSIIAELRGLANRNISDYFIVFFNSIGEENLFIKTISEIGWTMFPLGAIMTIIPDSYDFLYGKSYFYALTSLIPNLGFWEVHPAKKNAGGASWLMDTLNLWSGPGFTPIAEAFQNFGWYGFTILIILGAIVGHVYSNITKNTIYIKPEAVCISLILFEVTIMSTRSESLSIIRPLFFVVIPIYLLIKIIYYILTDKRKYKYKNMEITK